MLNKTEQYCMQRKIKTSLYNGCSVHLDHVLAILGQGPFQGAPTVEFGMISAETACWDFDRKKTNF